VSHESTPSSAASGPPIFFAVLLLLIGGFQLVGGAWLALIGGSWYYLVAGVLIMGAAVFLFRGLSLGEHCYSLVLVLTSIWAVAESGMDPWALAARLLALAVVGLWFASPWLRRGLRDAPSSVWSSAAAWLSVLIIAGIALRFAQFSMAQEPESPGRSSPATQSPREAQVATDTDWQHYGQTPSGERFSGLTQITPDNVSKLKVAWIYRSGEVSPKGNITDESTPLKSGDLLYKCTPHSEVIAIDAKRGTERWRFNPRLSPDNYFFSICRGVALFSDASSSGFCSNSILSAGIDGKLRSLDAKSGQLCPDFGSGGAVSLLENIGEVKPGYYLWSSPPTVVGSRIIIGSTVYDDQSTDMPSGVIRAYDARTGQLLWAWDMGAPDRVGPPPSGQNYTRNTPNSWPPFSADEALGLVYVPMGNPGPDFFGGKRRPFDEKYGSAIVALSVSDGRPRWSFQTTHHDLWDYDLPAQPVLTDVPNPQGGTTPAVLVPTKRGDIFVLDRRDGKPIVPISEYAAPGNAVAGDWASKIQPVSKLSFMPPRLTEQMMWGATPLDMLVCRIEFRRARYDGPFTPPGLKTTLQYPGLDGSINWGSVAVDSDHHVMVSGTADMPWYVRLVARENESDTNPPWPQTGTPYVLHDGPFLGPLEMPCMQPPWGHIAAVDLATRKVLWRRPLGTARDTGPLGLHVGVPLPIGIPSIGGSLVTRSGLIFVGATLDNYLRALNLKTGKELWRARLPAGGQAMPMTYMQDGKQYIVVTAGGHIVVRTERGDYTIAYTLPEQDPP
jgi:quinoprotein glucose dehydrogenase